MPARIKETERKDKEKDYYDETYRLLPNNIFIENYLANNYFDYVVGVHSSVLIFAKQIYGNESQVISFGIDKLKFKNSRLRARLYSLFDNLGIIIL